MSRKKACRALDAGWVPVSRKNMRQRKIEKPRGAAKTPPYA
jgi:hypothetical protein